MLIGMALSAKPNNVKVMFLAVAVMMVCLAATTAATVLTFQRSGNTPLYYRVTDSPVRMSFFSVENFVNSHAHSMRSAPFFSPRVCSTFIRTDHTIISSMFKSVLSVFVWHQRNYNNQVSCAYRENRSPWLANQRNRDAQGEA